ncbi:MAG: hypothetical protein K8H74_17860 [Notoacmeibacter sp.]|nr:hypothetical protein [Notoacmeibacter sp.]
MLPRLQAEEQLAAINAAAIGGAHLDKADMMDAVRRLERRAAGGERRAARASPAMLAAMGIAVVEAPAREETGG